MAIFAPVLPEYSPGAQITLPAAAAGAVITAGAAGVAGAWAEVDDGTNVPAVPFYITAVSLDTPSAAMLGTVEVGYGAGGGEAPVASAHFEVVAAADVLAPIYFPSTVVIPGGTRVAARLTTVAGAETATVSLSMRPA